MIQLPSNLESYRQDAEKSIALGLVKDIEFSGSTYQVLVEDLQTHEEFWVFIQLEGKEAIKDAFCSCEEDIQNNSCLHLAVAYLSLFGAYQLPLHQRFARSLWNQICRLYSDHLGDDPSHLVKIHPGYYVYKSMMEKIILALKAKTPAAIQKLDTLLSPRRQETEETSLKFSNLSNEEISLWREGRPSHQLRYDLSYWSDLGKWFLKMQEEDPLYQISFNYSKKGLPNWLQANFSEVDVGFYLSEANLPIIIPALTTIKSPLEVKNGENRGISQIVYDKKAGNLFVEGEQLEAISKQRQITPLSPGIEIEGWKFIQNQGFYTEKPHALLQQSLLHGESLSNALSEHGRLISSLLSNASIHFEPVELSYNLFFDKNWNLHIQAYVFEPGDLLEEILA